MKNNSTDTKLMEKITSLAKRRGFIFQNSEIYGGLASAYDYGPLGTELKNNIQNIWWQKFVHGRDDMVGISGGVIASPEVWKASGHIEKFKDPLVECKKCHRRYRPDKLIGENKCPECGGDFTPEKLFLGMFKTTIGPVEEEGTTTYLRPETAQSIFINFKNILDSTNKKVPFGIAQVGKAFRNEVTTGNLTFRTYEFEQMEIEYFIPPKSDWKSIFNTFLKEMHDFGVEVGLKKENYRDHDIPKEERAHYSEKTIDIEYKWPFGTDELWGLAYRGDYDLSSHQKASGKDLSYFDDDLKERYLPHVIEPSFGLDRTLLAVLIEAYDEETTPEGEVRTVLRLKPKVAPFKTAVFPLLKNKPELVKKAREVYEDLKKSHNVFWDDRGNIGKRYRYQDEIGTPFCITIDFETLEKGTVTLRDRDTMKQEKIAVSELKNALDRKLSLN